MSLGQSRPQTYEICSLALAKTNSNIESIIALMDVDKAGLAGFLTRETSYEIFEVPYIDEYNNKGIALACGEATDKLCKELWGENNWFSSRCTGKVSYSDHIPSKQMPLVPRQFKEGAWIEGDPKNWIELSAL